MAGLHAQKSADEQDRLKLYGEPYDKKQASSFFDIRVSISPNVLTLGGPVLRGAQAIHATNLWNPVHPV